MNIEKALAPLIAGLLLGMAQTGLQAQESTWAAESGIRQEGGWAQTASIVEMPDGSYRSYNGDRSPWTGAYPVIIDSWISPDGMNWTKDNRVLVGGPSYWANSPEVVKLPDGRMRMYFTNEQYPFGAPQWGHIVSAISSDGIEWKIEDGVRVDNGGPHDPDRNGSANIVKLPDGRLRMYYEGAEAGRYHILSAISEDGLAWTKEAGVRIETDREEDKAGALAPHVVRLPDGRYLMFYGGSANVWSSTILSAVSEDGLTWVKEPGARLAAADFTGGPYSYLVPGEIVKLTDYSYRMYVVADRYPNVFAGDRIVTLSAVGTIKPSYQFSGFLPPVSLGKPFKLGSTVPVKFQLTDAGGNPVSNVKATLTVQKFADDQPLGEPVEAIATGGSDQGNTFRYSAADNVYIYNLDTSDLSAGKWQIRATLDGSVVKTTFVSVKAR